MDTQILATKSVAMHLGRINCFFILRLQAVSCVSRDLSSYVLQELLPSQKLYHKCYSGAALDFWTRQLQPTYDYVSQSNLIKGAIWFANQHLFLVDCLELVCNSCLLCCLFVTNQVGSH
jgi:hypothetical protein